MVYFIVALRLGEVVRRGNMKYLATKRPFAS